MFRFLWLVSFLFTLRCCLRSSLSQCLCKSSLRLRRPAPVYIPHLPLASSSFSHSLAHPILKLYFWPFCGNCLLFGSGSGSNNLLLLLLLPPHHFLLTKNSLLGNFSLFILFATLQKCLYPGQSMPQMHSIVPVPFSSLSVVANRLPFTVRIPCISIEHWKCILCIMKTLNETLNRLVPHPTN